MSITINGYKLELLPAKVVDLKNLFKNNDYCTSEGGNLVVKRIKNLDNHSPSTEQSELEELENDTAIEENDNLLIFIKIAALQNLLIPVYAKVYVKGKELKPIQTTSEREYTIEIETVELRHTADCVKNLALRDAKEFILANRRAFFIRSANLIIDNDTSKNPTLDENTFEAVPSSADELTIVNAKTGKPITSDKQLKNLNNDDEIIVRHYNPFLDDKIFIHKSRLQNALIVLTFSAIAAGVAFLLAGADWGMLSGGICGLILGLIAIKAKNNYQDGVTSSTELPILNVPAQNLLPWDINWRQKIFIAIGLGAVVIPTVAIIAIHFINFIPLDIPIELLGEGFFTDKFASIGENAWLLAGAIGFFAATISGFASRFLLEATNATVEFPKAYVSSKYGESYNHLRFNSKEKIPSYQPKVFLNDDGILIGHKNFTSNNKAQKNKTFEFPLTSLPVMKSKF